MSNRDQFGRFIKGHQINKGRKLTEEWKKKVSENHARYWLGKKNPDHSGVNHELWKGGVTPVYKTIRKSKQYKEWRTAVFMRDNYTCIECRSRGVDLEADHIKPFSTHPELRFEVSNGRTLCKPCHRKTNTWGVNVPKKVKQFKNNSWIEYASPIAAAKATGVNLGSLCSHLNGRTKSAGGYIWEYSDVTQFQEEINI